MMSQVPADSCLFSVIDLSNVYFSIPLHPECKFWLAFTFSGKRYTWAIMPQGYSSSPTLFAVAWKFGSLYINVLQYTCSLFWQTFSAFPNKRGWSNWHSIFYLHQVWSLSWRTRLEFDIDSMPDSPCGNICRSKNPACLEQALCKLHFDINMYTQCRTLFAWHCLVPVLLVPLPVN